MFKPRQNPGAASPNRNLLSFVIWAGCASSMLMVSASALGQAGQPAAEAASSARTSARAYPEFGEKAVTRPSRDATMGFSNPTQVKEIAVKGGQKVKLGQLLIRGDDQEDIAFLKLNQIQADTDLPVLKARAGLDLAQLEFDRTKEAHEKGAAALQDFDRSRISLDAARIDWETAKVQQDANKASVDRAKARVDRMSLMAPFDGQVDVVMVDAGQAVSENDKVVRVVNVDLIWIDVPVRMDRAGAETIRLNDPAWTLTEIGGVPALYQGKVIEVSPVADPASRTRRVRVEITNPAEEARRVIPGEPAWVRFERPSEELMRKLGITEVSARIQAAPGDAR